MIPIIGLLMSSSMVGLAVCRAVDLFRAGKTPVFWTVVGCVNFALSAVWIVGLTL